MGDFEGKKLFIFDLDKTIMTLSVDWPSCRVEVQKALERQGLNFPDNTRVDEMEAKAFHEIGKDNMKEIFAIREQYEAVNLDDSELNHKVHDLIKSLSDRTLTVCSNNLHKTVERALELHDLKDDFEMIVAVDDAGIPKPDPTGCNMILDKFKVKKEEVIFIGDNESTDGEVSKKLGIDYLDVRDI